MSITRVRIAIFALLFLFAGGSRAGDYGVFIGDVVAKWLGDNRRMELMEPFAYIDQTSVRWDAPKGWIVDGASIPQAAWSFIGGPYEGAYRQASVIHDVACDQKMRPWQQVHLAFYNAMLAAGVDPIKAKVMYSAVYLGGPRWPRIEQMKDAKYANFNSIFEGLKLSQKQDETANATLKIATTSGGIKSWEGPIAAVPSTVNANTRVDVIVKFEPKSQVLKAEDFDKLKVYIENNNPSLAEIEQYVP